ncbi:MAG: DNA adenine methylase [Flavobacteriales bacterium]|nr:DNA adenine methylase [Flavobacteriales bacterium]
MSKDQLEILDCVGQFQLFPGTRFMGSKNKIIHSLWGYLNEIEFDSFLDVFAGSNVVSYFMKTHGKKVVTNDFMSVSHYTSKAIIENSTTLLSETDVLFLLNTPSEDSFVSTTFKDLYFTDEENQFLDQVRANIDLLDDEFKKAIAIASLTRACMKKRPRGIFTFIGQRYDDGRKDIRKSLKQHFIDNVEEFNNAVFDNGTRCAAHLGMAQQLNETADLVYLDPPYYSPKSDNDYVRRYHFVEGLARKWEGLEIQEHTITKKFKSYQSPFSKRESTFDAFHSLIESHKNSIIAISYSSNSIPTKEELTDILKEYKNDVEVHEIDHTYSFGTQSHKIGNKSNRVKEYLFIGK